MAYQNNNNWESVESYEMTDNSVPVDFHASYLAPLICLEPLCAFQQNETAIDVARRKEHPEIILIITSLSRVRCFQGTRIPPTSNHIFLSLH